MIDITLASHPVELAKIIRSKLGDKPTRGIAYRLGMTTKELSDLLWGVEGFSAETAVKLCEFGLDGRELFLRQEERRFEIQRRYETGEMKRFAPYRLDAEAVPA